MKVSHDYLSPQIITITTVSPDMNTLLIRLRKNWIQTRKVSWYKRDVITQLAHYDCYFCYRYIIQIRKLMWTLLDFSSWKFYEELQNSILLITAFRVDVMSIEQDVPAFYCFFLNCIASHHLLNRKFCAVAGSTDTLSHICCGYQTIMRSDLRLFLILTSTFFMTRSAVRAKKKIISQIEFGVYIQWSIFQSRNCMLSITLPN